MPADPAPVAWQRLPQQPLLSRRSALGLVTATLFLLGMILLGRMFLTSLTPTAATLSAHILEVDLSDLAPGQVRRINWAGHEVVVLHRTPAQIAWLAARIPPSEDGESGPGHLPVSLRNPFRSLSPAYLVVNVESWRDRGMSSYRPSPCDDFQATGVPFQVTSPEAGKVILPGGFFCPQHQDLAYDPAGNSMQWSYLAPLGIPPHRFAGKRLILDRTWDGTGSQP